MVSDKQYWRLLRLLKMGKTLSQAAAAADMDEKTARRYRRLQKPPSQSKTARGYRTRRDVFADVWMEITPFLEGEPLVEAKTLLEYLLQKYPDRFGEQHLRTLQRRVKAWRATSGLPKEVFFEQRHEPGRQAQSDFTNCNDLDITIARQPFKHLFYHFCLTYSNWETGMVCFSESFEALSEGLQNALWELGRVPTEHRTDNLTAAVTRIGQGSEFTAAYTGLLAHYALAASHTNPASANENGDVEQAHHRFKRAVRQALILRGHRDFETRDDYHRFLRGVLDQRNRRRAKQFAEELAVMRMLPTNRLADFTPVRCRVSRNSTVWVKKGLYSVPSQLIGEWVNVRLFVERLEVWYGDQLVEQLERVRGGAAAAINYRHVIHSLVKKPAAFARYRHRQQLFPRFVFRVAYDRLRETAPASADKQYLQVLELAATISEDQVATVLHKLIETGGTVSADAVRSLSGGGQPTMYSPVTMVAPVAVELALYDALLANGGEEEAR